MPELVRIARYYLVPRHHVPGSRRPNVTALEVVAKVMVCPSLYANLSLWMILLPVLMLRIRAPVAATSASVTSIT